MKSFLKYFSLCILFAFECSISLAQSKKIDSLRKVLSSQKDDTSKVKSLNLLASFLYISNPDSTILLTLKAVDLAVKFAASSNKDISKAGKKGAINAYNLTGVCYGIKGDFPKSLDYFLKSLSIEEELGNKRMLAFTLGNLGNVYKSLNEYTKALDYYKQALKLSEEVGNKYGQSTALGNSGLIYSDMSDSAQSRNKITQSDSLSKIALDYLMKALKINQEIKDMEGLAINMGNIATVYKNQGKYNEAEDYYMHALKIADGIGDKRVLAFTLGNIGLFYTKTKKFQEAEYYLKKSIALDSIIGDLNNLKVYEENLSNLYDTTGHYKDALNWYKKAMVLKDTLFNIDKDKAITRKEMTYEFEKKEAAEKAQQEIKDAKQRTVIRSVVGGLILVLIFAGFIFRSLRITRRQKQLIEIKNRETEEQKKIVEMQKAEVEHQKQLVEEKNKDILDSITYAKRLQDAILPPLSLVKQYLPESFLLYKPKDIVAGDFYWMERAGDNILVAAADCTGHGVPGALVSVVCSNALNRTVKEFHITEPGKILDKVRELVLETFEKSEGNIQDGMDISLCCINTDTKEAQWSGAYNSLWYFRNGEVTEVPADKQPIGKTDKPEPFNTHNLNLQKGYALYLFTDGYADQFGGPKGKKFKYKQMQELLLENASKPMDEQKKILEDALNEWKGSLEQVDDVLVIGIRV